METIDPFANESESLRLDDLTIENRTDKVSLYGSIEITRDKRGFSPFAFSYRPRASSPPIC